MAGHKPGSSNLTWIIVFIIIGGGIVSGLMSLRGMPLWAQFATVGILIVIAAVVLWAWRRSRGKEQ